MVSNLTEEFLNIFWELSENADEVRTDAVVKIIDQLTKIKDSQNEKDGELFFELQYAIKRLIKGLASGRKGARYGFFVALVEILRAFRNVDTKFVLEIAEENFPFQEKEDTKDSILGLVLIYAALFRSERRLNDDQVEVVANRLVIIANKNIYLEVYCADVITQLLESVNKKQFSSVIFPKLIEHFPSDWEKATPMNVWLLLITKRLFPSLIDKKFLKKHWKHNDLLDESIIPSITAVISKSTLAHPKVHPVCMEIIKAALDSEILSSFWTKIIDEGLFRHKDKVKANLAIELVKLVLPELKTSSQVQAIFSPGFIRYFIQNLSHPELPLHNVAKNFSSDLISFVHSCENADVQTAVITQLVNRPGTILFDKITKTSTLTTALKNIKPETVDNLSTYFMNYILKENDSNSGTDYERKTACELIRKIHSSNFSNWQVKEKILNYFAATSFFIIEEMDKDFKLDFSSLKNCSSKLLYTIRTSFFNIMSCLCRIIIRHKKMHLTELMNLQYEIIFTCNSLLKKPNCATPKSNFNAVETKKSWQTLFKLLKKLRADAADKEPVEMQKNTLFQFVLVQAMLTLLSHSEQTVSLIKDVEICCNKANGYEEINKDEPKWIEVLTDLVLSYVSTTKIVENDYMLSGVFPLMMPFMTVDAVNQILKVINPNHFKEEDEEEEEDESDDEEEEDDEEKDESNDDEDKSESSESEDENLPENTANAGLQKALQDALGENSETSDVDLDQADESELERLDAALSKVFQSKKKPNEELSASFKKFRSLCVDMIECIIYNPTIPTVCACLIPLYETLGEAEWKNDELKLKIIRVFSSAINIKEFTPYSDPKEEPKFVDIWKTLFKSLDKKCSCLVSVSCNKVCSVLIKCVKAWGKSNPKKAEKVLGEFQDEFKNAIWKYFKEEKCCIPKKFIEGFLSYHTFVGEKISLDIIDYISEKDIRFNRKLHGLDFLKEILNNTKELENWPKKTWNLFCAKFTNYMTLELKKGTLVPSLIKNLIQTYINVYKKHKLIFKEELEIPEKLITSAIPLLPKSTRNMVTNFMLSNGKKMEKSKENLKRKQSEVNEDEDESEESENEVEIKTKVVENAPSAKKLKKNGDETLKTQKRKLSTSFNKEDEISSAKKQVKDNVSSGEMTKKEKQIKQKNLVTSDDDDEEGEDDENEESENDESEDEENEESEDDENEESEDDENEENEDEEIENSEDEESEESEDAESSEEDQKLNLSKKKTLKSPLSKKENDLSTSVKNGKDRNSSGITPKLNSSGITPKLNSSGITPKLNSSGITPKLNSSRDIKKEKSLNNTIEWENDENNEDKEEDDDDDEDEPEESIEDEELAVQISKKEKSTPSSAKKLNNNTPRKLSLSVKKEVNSTRKTPKEIVPAEKKVFEKFTPINSKTPPTRRITRSTAKILSKSVKPIDNKIVRNRPRRKSTAE